MFKKEDMGNLPDNDEILNTFFKELRYEFPEEIISPELEAAHLERISASSIHPASKKPGVVKGVRKMRLALVYKMAAIFMTATLVGGTGAAYAGVLPDPVQEVAYQTASKVGVEIPRGWRHRDGVDGDTTNNGQNQPENAGQQYKNGQDESVETQGQGATEQKKLQEQEKLQEQNILQNKGTDTQIREETQNMNNSDQGMGDMDRIQDREQLRTENPEQIEDPIQEQKQIKLGRQ